jgi:predicted aldo/keto reductase-like oxidoreductase
VETRKLGKIDFNSTIITLGGCGPGYVSQEEADKAVELAFKKHRVNMIDVAPSYGDAEIRLNPWISKYRDKFFIAEKTTKRTKTEAWEELNMSLDKTGAKHFDLYQFHAVGSFEELDTILGKGGAMEAFIEAQETGLIKHIGITGHANIQVLVKALERFDFDTVLAPINAASMTNPHPHNDFRPLLKLAQEKDVGIIAIKSILKRRWKTEDKTYNTWYEPYDQKTDIEKALWFTLSQDGVSTYSLPCDVRLWELILDATERYKKHSLEELKDIIKQVKSVGSSPLFPEVQP